MPSVSKNTSFIIILIHAAFASARLRLQPHGRLRDGADDEGESVFCWLQHWAGTETGQWDHRPGGVLHGNTLKNTQNTLSLDENEDILEMSSQTMNKNKLSLILHCSSISNLAKLTENHRYSEYYFNLIKPSISIKNFIFSIGKIIFNDTV